MSLLSLCHKRLMDCSIFWVWSYPWRHPSAWQWRCWTLLNPKEIYTTQFGQAQTGTPKCTQSKASPNKPGRFVRHGSASGHGESKETWEWKRQKKLKQLYQFILQVHHVKWIKLWIRNTDEKQVIFCFSYFKFQWTKTLKKEIK